MADKGKQPSTRKPAHTIPLTHRQQRAKKRPQAEQVAAPSVSAVRKRPAAPARARRAAPSLAPVVAEPAIETPAALVEESAAEAPETAPEPEPRLVRVRVRRGSLPLSQVLPPDISREDTTILPLPRVFLPRATPSQPDEPTLTDEPLAAPRFAAPEESVEQLEPWLALPDAPITVEPEVVTEPVEEPASATPEVVAAAAPEILEEPVAVELEATEPEAVTEESAPTEEPEAQPAEQPERRRMPTLAVMAALAPRAEPTPPPDLDEAPAAPDEAGTLAAVTQDADFDVDYSATDADEAPPVSVAVALDETPAEAPVVESAAEPEETPSAVDTNAELAEEPVSAADAEKPAEEPAEEPAEGLETAVAEEPVAADAAPAVRSWMWWAHPPRRRAAAPETRPVAAAEVAAPLVSAAPDQDAVNTAPRRTPRRQAQGAASGAMRMPGPGDDSRHEAARTVASRADAEVDALAERRRVARIRQRYEAKHSQRAAALSWVAFGHAAVASLAALVAVIAGLRASSGADAVGTLVWALALALIAGLGAGFGFFYAQDGRPLLATLALLLSQVGAAAWAMALLGPRAALLALAPAGVALALRGAGRVSAFATGCAWFLLYWVDLALTLTGVTHPAAKLGVAGGALVDSALTLVGLWMIVNILISLYTSRMNALARGRAIEHVALQSEAQLARLRTQTEDDAEALRRALTDALRGEQPERVYGRGALSAVAEVVNEMADRLVDLRYDRDERKRLESATRRLTRVIERAWLGLSWSWPDATGTILDDLLALMRMPPPSDAPDQLDVTSPTGQVVAPHLFRGWRPTEPTPRVTSPDGEPDATPGTPSQPSQPSAPSLPSLLDGDPGARLTAPLELPPSPRWRGPDSRPNFGDGAPDESGATGR